MELSMDLSHLNNMKIILTLRALSYVDCVPFWTPGRADRGPIDSVPSVRPSATGISRERFIQFLPKLGMKLEYRKT